MERDARTHRSARLPLVGLLALNLAIAGCARRSPAPVTPPPSPPPTPATPVRPHPGYDARVDSLDVVDTAVLGGRRIAIDPGHGGYFRGSLGVNGLTEAEVNLSVALELERLLAARGAAVFLTRRDNRDFLSPADSSLRADLAERVRLANAFRPDFFISVHHNADPGGAHDRNEIQTYYKLGDEGPSLDASASLHRYLKRNLGIERHRIVPGNYFVLRNSDAPAVLTEASYLTNPDVEARLKLDEKRRLEAEALFIGIAHFFARRAPAIERFDASGADGVPDTAFAEIDGPRLLGRIGGSFDRADMELDGQRLEPMRRGQTLEWRPRAPLPGGRHEARLRVALSGVGASRERRIGFTITRRPASLRATWVPEARTRSMAVRIELLDRAGLPSSDSARVRLRALRPGLTPAETVVTARDGVAWAYVRVSRSATARSGALARLSAADSGRRIPPLSIAAPRASRSGAPAWTGWVLRMPGELPLRDVSGTREPAPAIHWLTRDGFATLARDSAAGTAAPQLPGFRAWGSDSGLPPRRVEVAGGALHGRRVLLDPEGGGEESGGMGPGGTRGAFYNMEVARALTSYLTAAGAEVQLARTGDYAASDVERVRIGEAFRADRYLRIGHRPDTPRLGYYFSSAAGKRWAQRTAAWLARLGGDAPAVTEDAQYPLQQSSSPALFAGARRVEDPADEQLMNAPGAVRAEAYALYLGVLEEWAGDGAWPLDSLEVRDAGGAPVGGALVTLGGALVLETDALGRVRFARTEPGPLEVRAEHPSVSARRVLLDSERGIVLIEPPRR